MPTAFTRSYWCPVCKKHVPESQCYQGQWSMIHTICADTRRAVFVPCVDGHEGQTCDSLKEALRFVTEDFADDDDIEEVTITQQVMTPREADALGEWSGW